MLRDTKRHVKVHKIDTTVDSVVYAPNVQCPSDDPLKDIMIKMILIVI